MIANILDISTPHEYADVLLLFLVNDSLSHDLLWVFPYFAITPKLHKRREAVG